MKTFILGLVTVAFISTPSISFAANIKPSVSIVSPTKNATYDRTEKMPINWKFRNITKDMVVVTKIELKKRDTSQPAVGLTSGSVSRFIVHEGDKTGSFVEDWGINPTIPGVYTITAELRECNKKGCNFLPDGKKLSKTTKKVQVTVTNNARSKPSTVSDSGSEIKLLSPVGGESYIAGSNDELSIAWEVSGVVEGSRICTRLERKGGDGRLFGFPGPQSCKNAVEGRGSAAGKLTRSPGYDLAPGKYWVSVVLVAPPSGGKDGGTLAQDISETTITLK